MVTEKKLNIIIFGASGSIGSFLLKKYFQKNHNLLLFLKDKKKLNSLKKKYQGKNSQIIKYEILDFDKFHNLKKKLEKNKNFIKKTNLIISTIGIQGEIKNFFDLNFEKFNSVFKINFFSQALLFKSIYKFIKKNKDTSIILFSGGGVTGLRPNFSPYVLSKIALVKLVEILAVEFKNKNLRINAISPGIIDSKMTRLILKKNKRDINLSEINKIKKEIVNSKKSLEKVYNLIDLLIKKKGKKISGKIISSRWDQFNHWNKKDIKKLRKHSVYTLRRNQKI